MKRAGPLPRRTPLVRVPLPRSAAPPAHRSKHSPPGESTAIRTARNLVYARSGGLCEIQLTGVCVGRAGNWHHRQGRAQGGEWRAANGLHVCGSGTTGCHGAVTNTNGRRSVYERNGWIVGRNHNPALVPVLLRTVWVQLDDTGGLHRIDAPQEVTR